MRLRRSSILGLLLLGCSSAPQGGSGGSAADGSGAAASPSGGAGPAASGGTPQAGGSSKGASSNSGGLPSGGTASSGGTGASGGAPLATGGNASGGGSGGLAPSSGGSAGTGGLAGTGSQAGSGGRSEPALLVMSKTAGFRHDSIPDGLSALSLLAEQEGWSLTKTEDSADFTSDTLAGFDAVLFLSTTGDILGDPEQTAFEQFIESGGGFIGVHAATDTEYDWDYYQELLGAGFADHPEIQSADVLVEDPTSPATLHLPATWRRTDEWYNFNKNPRPTVNVLLTLDEGSYQGGTMGADHPIAWVRDHATRGRVFYTALGHTRESYTEPEFLSHLAGGINWVLSQ